MPDFLADVLTWPKNYHFAIAVQTAYEMGLPPSLLIYDAKTSPTEWSQMDKKLVMAWTILQKETCQMCGQPLWICRSSEKNLQFKVRRDLCYASAELEKWKKSKAAKNLKDGEYPYVVADMIGDENLPSRKAYLQELNEE